MKRKSRKKWLLVMAVIFLVVMTAKSFGQESKESPVLPYLQNGDRFLEQGKFKEALGEYQKALSLDPNNQYAQFQVKQIQQKTGLGGDEGQYEMLPPRDYSKISYELGPVFKDPLNNFSIRPPKGWSVDNTDPNFTVKLTEPYAESFIFIKVVHTPNPVLVNYQFRDQVEALVKKLLEQIPGAALRYCNFEKFHDDTVLRTDIIFKTGPNKSLVSTRYISDINRVVIVSWVCQEKLFYTFRPWVESSIASLNLNPR